VVVCIKGDGDDMVDKNGSKLLSGIKSQGLSPLSFISSFFPTSKKLKKSLKKASKSVLCDDSKLVDENHVQGVRRVIRSVVMNVDEKKRKVGWRDGRSQMMINSNK